MPALKYFLILTLFFAPAMAAKASFADEAPLSFSGAYAYQTAPNQSNGAVFMQVKNRTGNEIKITAAASDVAQMIELHTHSMDGGTMSMYPVDSFTIPANGDHALKPTGDHIMLMMLNAPLIPGATFEVQVTVGNGEFFTVPVTVKSLSE
jgi:copper(I)-binding protein